VTIELGWTVDTAAVSKGQDPQDTVHMTLDSDGNVVVTKVQISMFTPGEARLVVGPPPVERPTPSAVSIRSNEQTNHAET